MAATKDERLDKLLRHRVIQPASIDLAMRIIQRSKELAPSKIGAARRCAEPLREGRAAVLRQFQENPPALIV
jgi:hypothetical protein